MSPQRDASAKTILLVDDDSTVLTTLQTILSKRGYKILAAQTVDDAIAAVRNAEIDLLVVDAVMPKVSGPELAEILLFLRPGMKILFITGLDELAIRLAFHRPCACLQKPFSVGSLISTVEELLQQDVLPPLKR